MVRYILLSKWLIKVLTEALRLPNAYPELRKY
jgi:hypothetical protein